MLINVKESLLLDPLLLRTTIPTSLTNSISSLPWVLGEAASRITLFGTQSVTASILISTREPM